MKTRLLKFEIIGKLLLILFCTAFLTGCDKDDPEPFSPYSSEDVYIAGGMKGNGYYTKAAYWKNDVPVILQEGPQPSFANDIFVSNGNVYAIGNMKDETQMHDRPCHWKNGTFAPLSIEGDDGDATSIFVDGDKTYIVGYDGIDYGYAKLWMGRYTETLKSPKGSRFNSVYVENNTVYIAGFEYEGSIRKAKYWIYKPGNFGDGVPPAPFSTAQSFTLAESSSGLCDARSITVKSGKIYVAGFENIKGMLWVDGEPTVLDPNSGYPSSIFIKGSDRYVSGTSGDLSTNRVWYWKNGSLNILDKGNAEDSHTSSIAVGKSNTYVTGYLRKDGNNWAVLWVNGVMKPLTPINERSWAKGIFLVEK